jgi:hypothetical protein
MYYYPHIVMSPMSDPVRNALKLYLNQDSRRSLRRLAEECKQHDIKTSLPTLKRWSVRYRWQQYIAEHDRAVTEQSITRAIDSQAQAMEAHFKLIHSAKRRYELLLGPNNPNLTPLQRKRAMHMTVSEYVKVLKIEMELYKHLERFEGRRSATPETPTRTYTAQEIDAMMRALAEVRHALPPRRSDPRRQARSDELAT